MEAIFITSITLQDILSSVVIWGEIFLNILLRWIYFSYSWIIRFEFGFLLLASIITCVGLRRLTIFDNLGPNILGYDCVAKPKIEGSDCPARPITLLKCFGFGWSGRHNTIRSCLAAGHNSITPFGSVLGLTWQSDLTTLSPAAKPKPAAFDREGNAPRRADCRPACLGLQSDASVCP